MKKTGLACLTLLIGFSMVNTGVLADSVSRTVPLQGEITRIYLHGATELYFTQGEEQFVKLTTSEEQMAGMLARVRGRSLYLGEERLEEGPWREFGVRAPVRFDVQLTRLDAVRVRGSGHVVLEDVVSDNLRLIMYGSGTLESKSIMAGEVRFETAGDCDITGELIVADEIGMEVAGSASINIAESHSDELEIEVAGSAELNIQNLQVRKLETEVSGSADIELAGVALNQDIEINGSGDYAAQDLLSEHVYLEIRGSGDAVISVERELTGELSRGATLEYYAGSGLKVDISGQGKSRRAGDIRKNE